MRKVISPSGMQRLALTWRRRGVRVAFVPTMGCLHEGHLDLVHRARRAVGRSGCVVVSIYVNPTQFGPHEDFARYPRRLLRDLELCRKAGVNVVFCPRDEAMYPGQDAGAYSTYVVEESLSHGLEGTSRPAFFRGVTTVVAKLLNLVLPDVAVFGAKDWQQATVVGRMIADLNYPVRLLVVPTRREKNGLAMSSRNRCLTERQRPQATVLWRAILQARERVHQRGSVPAARLRAELVALIRREPDARVDYVEFFEPAGLGKVDRVIPGVQLALAVFIGPTRLIDNATL